MIEKTNKETFEQYLTDASNYTGNADSLFVPETIDELKEFLKDSNSKKIPVTISGAGTGLTGGRVPEGGVIVSTERMNKIISIDEQNKLITIQPGLTLVEMENELNEHNLFYSVNPTEKNASIGGNIATNASGSRTFKYGPTRDYVMKLKVLLADGVELELNRGETYASGNELEIKSVGGKSYKVELPEIKMPGVKHAAGYYIKPGMDAIDLFIGSEGTLVVITEISLKLAPIPENVLGGIVFFDDLAKLFGFLEKVRDGSRKYRYDDKKIALNPPFPKGEINNPFNPSLGTVERESNNPLNPIIIRGNILDARTIEFFDNNSLKLLKETYPQVPERAVGAIWFEQEYESKDENVVMEAWYNLISEFTQLADDTWTALNPKEHNLLREFRHALPEKVFEIIVNNKKLKIGTDTAVPDEYVVSYYKYMQEKLEYYGLQHYIWGHIGNSHFHANVIVKTDKEVNSGYKFYDECIDQAIRLGGTVSAEHGIGKLKKKYFYKMYSKEAIEKMKAIKKVFDPNNILNRGNLFD
jgi:D-lactate dehydrogenase (cytochrome)